MNYEEAIEYLYNSLPVYQREGVLAYKPGLDTSHALDDLFGNPHRHYDVIHVAGTNGKGSTSHTIASVLARAGLKVGLYTSPHIFDFRERIRVNGKKISGEAVTDFVNRWLAMKSDLTPSFFELTSTMAFEYFAKCGVDVAVVETGLGGRLDSTNIVNPILSVITNISLDHTSLLGDTLEKIAWEKAGIIKKGIPVVIGEYQRETAPVFEEKARIEKAPLYFAKPVTVKSDGGCLQFDNTPFGSVIFELCGDCQMKNGATILTALSVLRSSGYEGIDDESVKAGFDNVCEDTGLFGRWTTISDTPRTIVDTGHNIGGWEYISKQLDNMNPAITVHLIIGFVNDKDISAILGKIASVNHKIQLYFSSPSVERGLSAALLAERAATFGLSGLIEPDVNKALSIAKERSAENDVIVIAGSNFLVADLKIGKD